MTAPENVTAPPPPGSVGVVPPGSGRGKGRGLLVVALLLLSIVAIGALGTLVVLAARASDDDEATATSAAVLSSEAMELPEAPTTTDGDGTSDDAGDGDSAEPDEGQPSTTVADTATMVAQYRMLLAEKGLPSEGLSDDVIETFASTACVFATAADTPDDFETFRQLAVQETQSVLSPEGRILTIDAAVVTFCPAEAERLGISV